MALAFAASACGDEAGDNADPPTVATSEVSSPSDGAAFPVSIEHAFGETVVASPPQRIVAWGWGSADAAIALGVAPAAIPFQAYGGDDEGVLPWIRAALEEQGEDVPAVLPNVQEPPFEAIAEARPDLILAVYSGITEEEYELLSAIAPTVAYPDEPWATPWQETIRIVGAALGLDAEADELLADIDAQVAAAGAAHPELAGKSVAMVWDTGDTFYVYEPADARVAFTLDLGLVSAPSVDALSTGESTFYFTLSKERLGELTSDILVSYADTPDASAAFLESAPAQLMEQVQRGAVAEVVGTELIAAVSPPTALSLTWGLDEYVEVLAGAAGATDSAP
jgi:iron complex transport system substrate-binding protein